MIKDIKTYYTEKLEKCGDILEKSLNSIADPAFSTNHNFLNDIFKWYQIKELNYESIIMKSAIQEYELSLFSLLIGQYRKSFSGLRFFLELSFLSCYLSTREFEFKLWALNQRDTNWHNINNEENGVFSKQFASCFLPELKEDVPQYRTLANKVYRECSEFTHGNYSTYKESFKTFTFDKELFNLWNEKAKTVRMLITLAFTIRYLKTLEKESVIILEPSMLDELGHDPPAKSQEIVE